MLCSVFANILVQSNPLLTTVHDYSEAQWLICRWAVILVIWGVNYVNYPNNVLCFLNAGRGSLELSGSGGAQQRRGNGATIDSINTVATATSGGASGSVGRSSKRRTMTKNSSQSRMANMAGGKLTPLHEELHMCALDDGVRDGGPGEAIGGVGGGARSPGTHRHPTPPISKCALCSAFCALFIRLVLSLSCHWELVHWDVTACGCTHH